MSSFETIDYIFILILLLSTLFGYARGFINEIFTLANVVLALMFTFFFYSYSYDFFAKQFTNNTVIVLFAGGGVFIVAWIIIAIINSFLADSLSGAKGKGLDKLLGTAFGLLRGALIIIAIFLGVKMGYKAQDDNKKLPEWMSHAKTFNFVNMQSQYFLELMPAKFQSIYKGEPDQAFGKMVEAVSPHGLLSDEERKLLSYGLTHKNIDTLKQVIHNTPSNFTQPMEFADLGKLSKKEFKKYAQDLIADYASALKNERTKPTIPRPDMESLKKSINDIEEDKNDLYKGSEIDKPDDKAGINLDKADKGL